MHHSNVASTSPPVTLSQPLCPLRMLQNCRQIARNLVCAGVPERVAMQLTGHKTRAVFERYNIVSEGDLTDAARRIDAAGTIAGTTPAIAPLGLAAPGCK